MALSNEKHTASIPIEPAEKEERTWGQSAPHVRKALKFIRAKGAVTAEQLVEWDARNGRQLFTWNNKEAAREYRLTEARWFLNRFRAMYDGMRVRAFLHVDENKETGIDQSAYYTIETIAQHPGMRAQIVADVTKRMENQAGELRMWRLTTPEQTGLFERLRAAMDG